MEERFQALQNYLAQHQRQSAGLQSWMKSLSGPPIMYAKYLEEEWRFDAAFSCAVPAVAMERFRLANRRWPQNLGELKPRYLKAVPMDPFSGQPLRMVRKSSALIVYSVGENQLDDGGTIGQKSRAHGPDLGFILHDPETRRRPGPPFVFPEHRKSAEGN